mmetsp:Transcript_390/g.477  ORF Transcript_390/g.477 Transcript_390/m.477 type:complete len:80 (+) Transcript_390:25-264(+)
MVEQTLQKNAAFGIKQSSKAEGKKDDGNTVDVDFDLVQPSEAYYHTTKALLTQYLDGPEAENLNLVDLADHILERASIG